MQEPISCIRNAPYCGKENPKETSGPNASVRRSAQEDQKDEKEKEKEKRAPPPQQVECISTITEEQKEEAMSILLFCHSFCYQFKVFDDTFVSVWKVLRNINWDNKSRDRFHVVKTQFQEILPRLFVSERDSFLKLEPLTLPVIGRYNEWIQKVYDCLFQANLLFLEHFFLDQSQQHATHSEVKRLIVQILRCKVMMLYFMERVIPKLIQHQPAIQHIWKTRNKKTLRLQTFLDSWRKKKGSLCNDARCLCEELFCSERLIQPLFQEMIIYGDRIFSKGSPEDVIISRC